MVFWLAGGVAVKFLLVLHFWIGGSSGGGEAILFGAWLLG